MKLRERKQKKKLNFYQACIENIDHKTKKPGIQTVI